MRARPFTIACALLLAGGAFTGCGGDDVSGTVELYDRAPVPAVPDRTAPIDPSVATAGADGEYWAQLVGPNTTDPQAVLTFQLTQALFAETCTTELGADGCPDGYGVIEQPSKSIDVPVAPLAVVTVVSERQQNYAITGDELVALAGGAPSAGAPEGFTFGDFPFLLTVRDGKVVTAQQIWVP